MDTPTAEKIENDMDLTVMALTNLVNDPDHKKLMQLKPSDQLTIYELASRVCIKFATGLMIYRNAGGRVAFIDPKGDDNE